MNGEPVDERNGDMGRMSRRGVDQLEIEIHAEKVKVWVDGASAFLADKEKVAALTDFLEKLADGWLRARVKTGLAAIGLTMLVSILLGGAIWMGWKGWAGPGAGR